MMLRNPDHQLEQFAALVPLYDVKIGNGSKVAVQWRAANYGPERQYKRAVLEAVQILELEEYSPSGDVALAF